jgi:hypothetical protein
VAQADLVARVRLLLSRIPDQFIPEIHMQMARLLGMFNPPRMAQMLIQRMAAHLAYLLNRSAAAAVMVAWVYLQI